MSLTNPDIFKNMNPLDIEQLKLKATTEDLKAKFDLATVYSNRNSSSYAPEKAIKILEKLKEINDQPLCYHVRHQLGMWYFKEKFNNLTIDLDEAIEFITEAANQEIADAMQDLGWLYHTKRIDEGPNNLAEYWYEKAKKKYTEEANKGDIIAKYNLARMYKRGYGTEKDKDQAIALYKEVISSKEVIIPSAFNNLACLYRDYLAKEKELAEAEANYKEAFDLFMQAHKMRHHLATFNLALMYLKGLGVTQDISMAEKYLISISNSKFGWDVITDPTTMFSSRGKYAIGYAYFRGIVSEDYNIHKAKKWLQEAADKGDKDAQFLLGIIYEFVEGDTSNSSRYYTVASTQGHEKAKWFKSLHRSHKKFKSSANGGCTLMHAFSASDNLEKIKELIEVIHSINPFLEIVNRGSHTGRTPLHYAIQKGATKTAEYLIKEANVFLKIKDCDNNNPLHLAVMADNHKLVKLLLKKNPNLCFKRNQEYLTPFDIAINTNKTCKELFAAELAEGNTILHYAAQRGDPTFIKIFLTQFPSLTNKIINKCNYEGETVLHYASQLGYADLIVFLLEKGAQINTKTKNGETPLHYAARHSKTRAIEALITRKAEISTANKQFETAIEIVTKTAAQFQNSEGDSILSNLLEHREKITVTSVKEALSNYQHILESGTDNSLKALDDTISSLVHTDISALHKNINLKYLDQWDGKDQSELWCPEEFISLTIKYLIELVIRIEKDKISLNENVSKNFNKSQIIEILTNEITYELETLRNRRDLLAVYDNFKNKYNLISSLSKNILNKILQLKEGESYQYNA